MWRVPYAYTADFTGTFQLAAPAGSQQQVAVDIDREADFAVYYVSALADSVNVRIALRDQSDRLFHDGIMPLVNLAGHGQLPRNYAAARIIRRTNQIRVTLTNQSGAPNNVRLLFTGAQLFPAPLYPIPAWEWAEDYSLAARFGSEAPGDDAPIIAANGSGEFAIRCPGDAWFEVQGLAISATSTLLTLQLLNDGNREWFRRPVHGNLLGTTDFTGTWTPLGYGGGAVGVPPASWPYRFTPPRLLPRNTSITVRVQDLSGAPNAIRVTLLGMRRYPKMPRV
jgi:hypothetical protein